MNTSVNNSHMTSHKRNKKELSQTNGPMHMLQKYHNKHNAKSKPGFWWFETKNSHAHHAVNYSITVIILDGAKGKLPLVMKNHIVA